MSKSKDKGRRFETGTAQRWQGAGIPCRRTPLSGALASLGPEFAGDCQAEIRGRKLLIQNKHLADGFKMLYGWLVNHDVLIVKADRKPPLVVIPEPLFLSLIGEADGSEGQRVCEAAE